MRTKSASAFFGAGGAVVAGGFGVFGALSSLLSRQLETSRTLWSVPYGTMTLGLDSLTAVFLLPVFTIGALAAAAALRRQAGGYAANYPREHWLFFNTTLAAAALVVVARNAVLFLFAWEIMTVASFLLVENAQRGPGQRSGGWVYLTAGHIGCACLFAMFALMARPGETLDFNSFAATGGIATAVFALAVAGFGGKFGLAPFHAWYTESYPEAPAHVGAILSGVIGNLGLYGLLRMLTVISDGTPPPAWWGHLLLFAGLGSALLGAARSLASQDLSKLLAWSSVENFGLMAAGTGAGLLGLCYDSPAVAFLGFAGALFHMITHAVSKALLFLSADAVYAQSGTRMLDRMGGMLKRLPATGALFFVGALGAAAVPPLSGFASEFLLLFSAFTGATTLSGSVVAVYVAAIAALALTGGLAAAAYMKAFGFIFLGNRRGAGGASAGRERRFYLIPHLALAGISVYMAALSPRIVLWLTPAVDALVRTGSPDSFGLQTWKMAAEADVLFSAALGAWLVAGCLALAFVVRWVLVRGKKAVAGPTWDCGYARPDSRMQYTAHSFSRPLVKTFSLFAPSVDKETKPDGLFPAQGDFASENPGIDQAWGYRDVFVAVLRVAEKIRLMQTGRVQAYLLYMAVVLVALLLWQLS